MNNNIYKNEIILIWTMIRESLQWFVFAWTHSTEWQSRGWIFLVVYKEPERILHGRKKWSCGGQGYPLKDKATPSPRNAFCFIILEESLSVSRKSQNPGQLEKKAQFMLLNWSVRCSQAHIYMLIFSRNISEITFHNQLQSL